MSPLNIEKGSTSHSAYNLRDTFAEGVERHTLAVIVANEAGVLARVIGLFSGRGYNIDSLTVAEVDPTGHS
jgi:acetolactate synthase-1/3 small subunit